MRAPAFWWTEPGLASALLSPLATVYSAVAARRLRQTGGRSPVPVVCLGNPTVGGAGKTPAAIAVANLLSAEGLRPVFLTRGYGGRLAGPLRVDPALHSAADVGDEPLLLARGFPTIVARDRAAGAHAAAADADLIVMDDGFQNPALQKDVAVLIVDARRRVGNGCVFPAGPLRAPLDAQLARAHAILVVGENDERGPLPGVPAGVPIFRARLEPDAAALRAFAGCRVLAFAGIADPEKFYRTLAAAGVDVGARRSFGDHHPYSDAEARRLLADADRQGLTLATTEKDHVRLGRDGAIGELRRRAIPLPVTMRFAEEAAFAAFVRGRLVTRA